MPLHPCPWDLTQPKVPRKTGCGHHHPVSPSTTEVSPHLSVCLSVSSGAIALEILQPHDQFILVLQQELLAGFKGGAETGGQSCHIGGDVVEVHRCSLIVVSHLRDRGDG